jgi:hypothetical protein
MRFGFPAPHSLPLCAAAVIIFLQLRILHEISGIARRTITVPGGPAGCRWCVRKKGCRMKRLSRVVTTLALLTGMALLLSTSKADEEKTPTIKEIMIKAHKGGKSLIQTVGKELKADEPNWTDLQKKTKELVKLGTALGKNEPPKGEKASWEKLTKEYVKNAKALDEAAKKQDKTAALASQKKLTSACASCHKLHK